MKENKKIVMVLIGISILAGCGRKQMESNDIVPEAEADFVSEAAIESAYPPCVRVDGILYKDTGYVDSMPGCGVMDGEITSSVDGSELPGEDNQSNFGNGFSYQRSGEGMLDVLIDGERHIFRDIESEEMEIPMQVIHFTGEVKEIAENGSLLVTLMETAQGFMAMTEGDYIVPTENLSGEVEQGEQVEIWFNGCVLETYPMQLGKVYRIEKK